MRLIDADALEEWVYRERLDTRERIANLVERMPTIDPMKYGKWELVDEAEPRRYGCSECKKLSYTQDNYCSYCGAKMKKRSFLMNWSESESGEDEHTY